MRNVNPAKEFTLFGMAEVSSLSTLTNSKHHKAIIQGSKKWKS